MLKKLNLLLVTILTSGRLESIGVSSNVHVKVTGKSPLRIVQESDSISPELRGSSPKENWRICGATARNDACDRIRRENERTDERIRGFGNLRELDRTSNESPPVAAAPASQIRASIVPKGSRSSGGPSGDANGARDGSARDQERRGRIRGGGLGREERTQIKKMKRDILRTARTVYD